MQISNQQAIDFTKKREIKDQQKSSLISEGSESHT